MTNRIDCQYGKCIKASTSKYFWYFSHVCERSWNIHSSSNNQMHHRIYRALCFSKLAPRTVRDDQPV